MISDLKYAIRQLVKTPGFTVFAILTLAISIGANTTIFSLIDTIVLKMLPVKAPNELVLFSWDKEKWPPHFLQTGSDARFSFSYPAFQKFREQKGALADIFAFVPLGVSVQNTTIGVKGESTLANGMMVTGDYFSGLDVNPILGRIVTEQDEITGAPHVAVISYAYWTHRFSRDPQVIGQSITVNSIAFTIVGIAPRAFYGVQSEIEPDIWVPFSDQPSLRPWSSPPPESSSVFTAHDWICLDIMGRLKPSISRAQAEAELDAIFRHFLTETWAPKEATLIPHLHLQDGSHGSVEFRQIISQPLNILMSAVGLLLLVSCANLATLSLARSTERKKEISVRIALGAPQSRIIRQVLTESILLSVAAGVLGLFLADYGTQTLLRMILSDRREIPETHLDIVILLFTVVASALTVILCGVTPAIRATRLDLASVMKETTKNVSEGNRGIRLGPILVVAQVAASVVLMICAGLFVRTLRNMENKSLGFNQTHLLLFGIDATRNGYQGDRLMNLYGEVQTQVRELPGVQAVTLYESLPFMGANNTDIKIDGSKLRSGNQTVRWQTVGPDFSSTMQIPLLLGRDILARDTTNASKVGLVNETFVHRFFPDENPLGHYFEIGTLPFRFQIIGVLKDAELTDLHARPMPKAFISYMQAPQVLDTIYFEVRTEGSPVALLSDVREKIRRVDPNLPLLDVSTQAQQTVRALWQERMFAQLSSFFGLIAVLLACIGLYGTMTYSVARKTREIGIRMALGAQGRAILGLIVGQGLQLALIGIALGIAASFCLNRFLRFLLYDVSSSDPLTYVVIPMLLIGVAVVACYLPALRATKVDPAVTLRAE